MLGLRPQQDEKVQPTGLVRPSKHVHMVDENGQSLLSGGKLSSKTPFGGKMPGRKALGNITNKQPQGTPLPAKTPAGKIQHISRRALGDITNTPAALRPTQQSLKRPPSLQKPATAASTALPRPSQLFTQQEEKLPAASAVQQGAVQQAAPQVDADLQTLAELYAEDGVEGLLGKSGDCLAAERSQREADEAAAFADAWVAGPGGNGNWRRPQMKSLAQLAAGWTVEVPPRPPSPAEHLLEDLLQDLSVSYPDSELPHVESRLDDLLADFCSNNGVSSDDDISA